MFVIIDLFLDLEVLIYVVENSTKDLTSLFYSDQRKPRQLVNGAMTSCWCAEYGNCTPENSIGYSKKTIENKRNFSLHTGDLVEKCHTLQTGLCVSFVALLHCCTSALYCIIVRMREFDTKFLAGIIDRNKE